MRIVPLIILISLAFTSALGRPYEYQWKTLKADIQMDHRLDAIVIEGLQSNLTSFLGESEASKFDICIVDDMRMQPHCDVGMFSMMGFYSDSLILFSLATEEMPYSEDDVIGDCLRESLFGKDAPLLWKPIFKLSAFDGDIFWEGGMCGVGEAESDYRVSLKSLGLITKPDFLQHTLFFFDKEYLDDVLQNKMKVHADHKQKLHPTALFVEYLVDEFEIMQEPIKE